MQATPYTRATSFADDERNNTGGRATVRTAQVDAELDALATPLNQTIANLALIQRDDGEIRDGMVKPHTFSADVLKMLSAVGTIRGAWVTATVYSPKDIVTQSGNTYVAASTHTAGTFATDLAAGRWILLQLGAGSGAASIPFTPTGTIASTNVQAAIAELDTDLRAVDLATDAALRADMANAATPTKGAGLSGFLESLSYAAGTVGGWLRGLMDNTSTVDGASKIGIRRASGSLPTNLHDWIAALPFRNVLSEYGTIQAAIDAANAAGGGRVVIPRKAGGWNLGTTGLTIYSNIDLDGEVEAYVASTRGVELIYSGTGSAISGTSLLNVHIRNFSIDCTSATGTAVTGLFFDGIWLSSISDVRVKGVGAWKGYGILVRTGTAAGPWGTQHVTFERIECPDGIIRMEGPTASDGVTTTVLNTVRGYQYEFQNAQGALINCTHEIAGTAYNAGTTYQVGAHVLDSGTMYVAKQISTGNAVTNTAYWRALSGYGMLFDGAGTNLTVMACDMEGNMPVGVTISGGASVREAGAGWIWNGFSGAVRVAGTTDTARSYGGAYEWIGPLTPGTPVTVETFGNQNAPGYLREELMPVNVVGGSQEGYRRWSRYIGGAEVLTHEWQRNALVEHSKAFSATTAQTVLQIRIPAGRGVQVDCQVEGAQSGDQTFTIAQRVVARNGSGTVTAASDTALTIPAAYAGAFTYVASGNDLLIKYTPTTANASTLNFTFHVRGAFTLFTKG